MGKNLNIGGDSYTSPGKNIGKIDTRSAQQVEAARAKHDLMLKLSNHMESCPICQSGKPAECETAKSLKQEWNNLSK